MSPVTPGCRNTAFPGWVRRGGPMRPARLMSINKRGEVRRSNVFLAS